MRTRVIAAAAVMAVSVGTATLVRPSYGDTAVSQTAFRARVIGVYDGDTILVRPQGQSRWQQIRLYGIDAPEYDPPSVQRMGYASFEEVYTTTLGRDVTIKPVIRDFYGRIVAEVYLADGTMLQTHMLDQGLAWVYRQYVYGARRYDFLDREAAARAARKGLWVDQNPTPPWVWRKAHH